MDNIYYKNRKISKIRRMKIRKLTMKCHFFNKKCFLQPIPPLFVTDMPVKSRGFLLHFLLFWLFTSFISFLLNKDKRKKMYKP